MLTRDELIQKQEEQREYLAEKKEQRDAKIRKNEELELKKQEKEVVKELSQQLEQQSNNPRSYFVFTVFPKLPYVEEEQKEMIERVKLLFEDQDFYVQVFEHEYLISYTLNHPGAGYDIWVQWKEEEENSYPKMGGYVKWFVREGTFKGSSIQEHIEGDKDSE